MPAWSRSRKSKTSRTAQARELESARSQRWLLVLLESQGNMEPVLDHESSLSGVVIPSDVQAGVQYRLIRYLGEGAMGVAYLAQRETSTGASPVVIKSVRPQQMVDDIAPELLARKEAVALGRLNDRVPPSPFVVRFIDTGNARVFGAVVTPWLA